MFYPRASECASRYYTDLSSLSHSENNAYVHKTIELGRLGRMHYARAYSRCITRLQKRVFRSNPRKLLPPKSYFAAAFPIRLVSRGVKNFRGYRGGQFVGFGSSQCRKSRERRARRIQSDLIKKAWNASECSRKSRKLLSVELLCILSLVESP